MSSPFLFAQSKTLRFADPAMEAAYRADRNERDARRAAGVQLAFAILLALLGAIILAVNARQHSLTPREWLLLRFGVLVPALLGSGLLLRTRWGRRHLQILLGFSVALAVGAHTLEWFFEWTPAMSLRSLWVVPITVLWCVAMTLPLNATTTVAATLGVFAIAQGGTIAIVAPRFGPPAVVTTTLAFAVGGVGLAVVARWRERDSRELFAHRREHERLLAELRAQYGTLQQLITQRDEFVAGVLHDLRSPLTGVMLSTDLLRTGDHLPPDTRAAILEDIARSAKRVDSFASQFLDQRLLERAAAKPALVHVPLDAVVERAVAHAQIGAAHKQQSIQLEFTASGQTVVADELLLDRAIGNVLDNAVKYSPLGANIIVRVDVEPGPSARTIVSVADSGPGFSAAEQTQLFQPYLMLGHKPTGGESSTGLGLSLVKHCIEGMGGAVSCESEAGRGATFRLALRRAVPAI